MEKSVTATSAAPATKKEYDPIQMLRDFLKDTPDAPAFLSNYLVNRLGDQIIWYDKKSTYFKKLWERYRRIVIILSASIPFLVGLIGTDILGQQNDKFDFILKLIVGLSGVIIAVLEGFNQLFKSQDHYIDYRITTEQLKQEFSFFLGASGKYEGLSEQSRYSTLVSNCESIVANENNRWANVARENEKAAQAKDIQETMTEFLKQYGVVDSTVPPNGGGDKPKPKPKGE